MFSSVRISKSFPSLPWFLYLLVRENVCACVCTAKQTLTSHHSSHHYLFGNGAVIIFCWFCFKV